MKINEWLFHELCKLEKIEDEIEREAQCKLLEEIQYSINKYENHINDYKEQLHHADIVKRGIIFEKSELSSSQLKDKWKQAFIKDLTEEIKREIYIHQFLWHTFSYDKLDAKEKSKARQAFNRKKKSSVYVFFQNKEETYYIANAQNLKASDFDYDYDVYILDESFKWTYIRTHESMCGPYYYSIK